MFNRQDTLAKTDADLWAATQKEDQRQQGHIELIASENYTSPAGDAGARLAGHQIIRAAAKSAAHQPGNGS